MFGSKNAVFIFRYDIVFICSTGYIKSFFYKQFITIRTILYSSQKNQLVRKSKIKLFHELKIY